ncbi:MAG: hypothetical protein JJU06_15975 [Ectothiorhodospiraceae bacterium]|nr:hypothetical protein [Ectothiorhodospiraceae bacterium]
MTEWICTVSADSRKDAYASLGPLAEKTYRVEAPSAEEALKQVKAEIMDQRPMTTLPADLLDEWLQARPA